MAKAPTKQTGPPPPKSEADRATDRAAELFRDGEAILRRIARDGREEPSVAETRVLTGLLGWDKERIRKEVGRARSAHEWRGVAGTPQDRHQAAGRLAAAEKKLAQEGPPLREDLERLQATIGAKLAA